MLRIDDTLTFDEPLHKSVWQHLVDAPTPKAPADTSVHVGAHDFVITARLPTVAVDFLN